MSASTNIVPTFMPSGVDAHQQTASDEARIAIGDNGIDDVDGNDEP